MLRVLEETPQQIAKRTAPPWSLHEHIERYWPVVEPAAPFIDNWHIGAFCEHLTAVTEGQIKRLCVQVPPGTMKALDGDTPVLTTWGWKRHGDLASGDFVFGPDGQPKRVLGSTPEALEESYEVTFDDGSKIIAGAGHLWEVDRDVLQNGKWRRSRERMVVTTPELLSSQRGTGGLGPDRIPVSEPVVLSPKQFLIEPYILGAWLGDGSSTQGCLYAAETDVEHFKQFGRIGSVTPPGGRRKQAFYRIQIEGLSTKLRVVGLLNNKHIPEEYFEGSMEQRLSLLQGLMDTDGACSKNGDCYFTSKLLSLANGVKHLIETLGAKAYLTQRHTMLNGKQYGPHYKVSFTAPEGVCAFRLERKQSRVRVKPSPRTTCRYIDSVKPIGPRVVKCIQVEGQLYLAGRELIKTHNSLTFEVFWPSWEWTWKPWEKYICGSYSQSFAKRDSQRMRDLIESPQYQADNGHVFSLLTDSNRQDLYTNNMGGYRLAVGVGGGGGWRATRAIADDPINPLEAESPAALHAARLWWFETIPGRAQNLGEMAMIVIMQRLHKRDLSGEAQARDLGYDVLSLPMRYEPKYVAKSTSIGYVDPRKKEGELLFPKRMPEEAVKQLEKELGVFGTAAQLQQRPIPRGGDSKLFIRSIFEDKILKAKPNGLVKLERYWDKGFTAGGGAYTAGVLRALWPDGSGGFNGITLDVVRGRWGPAYRDEMILATAHKDKATYGDVQILLEQEPGSQGRDSCAILIKKLAGFKVKADAVKEDKTVRAIAYASQHQAGNEYLLEGPWNEEYIAEHEAFPEGEFKDQVDASSGGFNWQMLSRSSWSSFNPVIKSKPKTNATT